MAKIILVFVTFLISLYKGKKRGLNKLPVFIFRSAKQPCTSKNMAINLKVSSNLIYKK